MKYLAVLLLLIAFYACKKSKTENPAPTKTALITTQSWQYESGGIDQDRNGSIDISLESTGQAQPCLLDNTGAFHTDGTGLADEGATKCSPTVPQTNPFTWSFANTETMLNITGSGLFGQSGTFKIQSLTTTRLGLAKDTTLNIGGVPFTASLILNLKH
jgi:hypothetical protein